MAFSGVASAPLVTFLTCQCLQVGDVRHVRNVPHVLAPPGFPNVMIQALVTGNAFPSPCQSPHIDAATAEVLLQVRNADHLEVKHGRG